MERPLHEPSVYQERNEHDLMKDFKDEVPGYLFNRRIAQLLQELPLQSGVANVSRNLYHCYEALVREQIFESRELPLVEAWINDMSKCQEKAG